MDFEMAWAKKPKVWCLKRADFKALLIVPNQNSLENRANRSATASELCSGIIP
jgi:hypothetical protein